MFLVFISVVMSVCIILVLFYVFFVFFTCFQVIRRYLIKSEQERSKIKRKRVILMQTFRDQHGLAISMTWVMFAPLSHPHTSKLRMTRPSRVPWHDLCQSSVSYELLILGKFLWPFIIHNEIMFLMGHVSNTMS